MNYKKNLDYIYSQISCIVNRHIKPKKDEIKIMLCGKGMSETNSIRSVINNYLLKDSLCIEPEFWKYQTSKIVYPEKFFKDYYDYDLLKLENKLAELVDIIIIVVESPGSYCELGAFANHDKLNKKLIVIVNEEFKKHKSFIIHGPVKLLKNNKLNQVIYLKFNEIEKVEKHIILDKIFNSIDKLISYNKDISGSDEVFTKEDKLKLLILMLLFFCESLIENNIIDFICKVEESSVTDAKITVHTILSDLIDNHKFIKKENNIIDITNEGIKYIFNRAISKEVLNYFRVKVLNYLCRNKKGELSLDA